jgi:hypothetical protein
MAAVDYEQAWRSLRHELRRQRRDEGRTSFGTGALLELLDDCEDEAAIDESQDRRVLRRLLTHLTDVFFNLTHPAAVADPLDADDRPATSTAMDGAADIRSDPGGHDDGRRTADADPAGDGAGGGPAARRTLAGAPAGP